MRKSIFIAAVATSLIAIGSYYFYQVVLSEVLAGAISTGSLPDYIPKRMEGRIQELTKPVARGTESLMHEIHLSGIPMEKILSAIDKTSEDEAYHLLDELNTNIPKTTNEVFTLIIEHLQPDFNAEVFRKPFNDHVKMKDIRKLIHLANQNRKHQDVEFTTAKAIIKKILRDADEKYQAKQRD